MHNPLVSVIIPNYCHAKYLDQRIQSILDQTYQNFEIIILDDCSPDNGASRAVIENYRTNSHVSHIVYNNQNSGSTFKQWQKGFELSKGDYIWIAESDDFCEPDLLEKLMKEFEQDEKCVLAFSASQMVNEYGIIIPPIINKSTARYSLNGCRFVNRYMTMGNKIWNASSAIFNKKIALSIDNVYTEYKGGGDKLFWILIAIKGSVGIVQAPLNYFRRHSGVVTNKRMQDGTNFKEAYRTYKYMKDKKIMDKGWALFSKWYYQLLINDFLFENSEIKEELVQLWGGRLSTLSLRFKRIVLRIVNRYR